MEWKGSLTRNGRPEEGEEEKILSAKVFDGITLSLLFAL